VGDDYWKDPLTGHDAFVIDKEGNIISNSKLPSVKKRSCTPLELKKCFFVLTQSMCFRNAPILKNMPEESYSSKQGDVFLISILGQYGGYKYHDDIKPTAYRVHESGIWGMKSAEERLKMNRSAFEQLSKYYGRINDRRMELYHSKMVLDVSQKLFQEQFKNARDLFGKIKCCFDYIVKHYFFAKPAIVLKLHYISLNRGKSNKTT
jgi:hypothetical protein